MKMVGMMDEEALVTQVSCIVSVDACINLTYFEQNQKCGRIPTIVRRSQHHSEHWFARHLWWSAVLWPPCHQLSVVVHQQHGIKLPAACSCHLLSGNSSPGLSWIRASTRLLSFIMSSFTWKLNYS